MMKNIQTDLIMKLEELITFQKPWPEKELSFSISFDCETFDLVKFKKVEILIMVTMKLKK